MRLIKLSLVLPSEHVERAAELLTSMSPAVDHFIMWKVEGNLEIGQGGNISEQVRGRLDQSILLCILPELQVQEILDRICAEFTATNISYWLEHVEGYGQLTSNSS